MFKSLQLFLSDHIWVIGGLLIFLFGISITFILAEEWYDEKTLQKEGQPTEGTIIFKNTYRTTYKDGSEQIFYQIRYSFKIKGEQYESQFLRFPYETWKDLEVNGPITIMYLPSDPSVHNAVGQRVRDMPERLIGLTLGIISIVVGLGLGGWYLLKKPMLVSDSTFNLNPEE